ncbi:ABC transporter substrate-binding protein [uncultured Corynebacterium sp.]|uniref:ABC transporter substrate-binding protein n=1 Tax=uncultured Corynebacterium sp. TaxID=159447 RepID=UPI0025EE4C71|nr:ABC transporter substrate-binding protein [uncultured Corynebacterium sp.]
MTINRLNYAHTASRRPPFPASDTVLTGIRPRSLSQSRSRSFTIIAAIATSCLLILTLSSCARSNPLSSGSADSDTVVIGSQDYYSNEIIAEIYAQALEKNDIKVDRQFRIGQREVYIPEIEHQSIDLIPEYSGNLLQYFEKESSHGDDDDATAAKDPDDVYRDLVHATPQGLHLLNYSPASDQDTYTVTHDFAQRYHLHSVGDLARVPKSVKYGGPSEAESRPYGPKGLKAVYGVDVDFTPIEDSGGPLTVKALTDGKIQVANIFSADPAIKKNNLTVLDDPQHLLLPSNVVPLPSKKLNSFKDGKAEDIINSISKKMTTEDLAGLNNESVTDQKRAARIAKEWLAHNDISVQKD